MIGSDIVDSLLAAIKREDERRGRISSSAASAATKSRKLRKSRHREKVLVRNLRQFIKANMKQSSDSLKDWEF